MVHIKKKVLKKKRVEMTSRSYDQPALPFLLLPSVSPSPFCFSFSLLFLLLPSVSPSPFCFSISLPCSPRSFQVRSPVYSTSTTWELVRNGKPWSQPPSTESSSRAGHAGVSRSALHGRGCTLTFKNWCPGLCMFY